MPDRYTEAEAQRLDDVDWIPDVSGDDLVIFSKDSGLKTDPERAAIIACEARVFLVPDTQASAEIMIERYTVNRYRIAQRSRKPGPYIYIARPDRLEKVKLD